MQTPLVLSLFLTFFRIGSFTFGGGYAMLPLIERDVVERKRWLSHDEFIDLFAVAQSLPGVFAVNIAIFVGYRLARKKGGIVAALGTILPSFLIILLLAITFESIKENPHIIALMRGIRPAVVALITVPIYTTWRTMKLSWYWIFVPVVASILVWLFGVSPILVIIISGCLGILYQEGIRPHLNKITSTNRISNE